MEDGAPKSAAEKAEERERLYIESLRSQWKVPLSQEQYAIIRAGLLPIMQARVEREADEATATGAGDEDQDTPPPHTAKHSDPAPFETPWMTVPDVCRYAHANKNIVYRALQVGELRGHQHVAPRGTWRVHRDDVDLWLRGEIAGTKASRIRPHGRGS